MQNPVVGNLQRFVMAAQGLSDANEDSVTRESASRTSSIGKHLLRLER